MAKLDYTDFIIQPLKNNKIKLLKEVKYKDITIPAGFESDGASIIWVAKLFNIARFRMDYLPCAIIHDYLCDKEEYKKADILFEEALIELEVGRMDIAILIGAVKLYHKLRYGV